MPPELANHSKFRILKELGRGGMGVVYKAENRFMEMTVALKVINKSLLDNPAALERFDREVRAAAKLVHPHIVRALDAERAGELRLLVMEFVEGASLFDVLKKKGPLPIPHACHYARQAALGLQHAHEQGMVHRDIKPHNLMLTPRGQVKILDFGLARLASEQKRGGGLTRTGDFMGTPDYVAPEQAMDASQADIRADIYSLGCTLYALLTGRPPFQEDSVVNLVLAHIQKEPVSLSQLRSDIPAELSAVVDRMLTKDPAQRFQTPLEVAQALAPFCKTSPKPAAQPLPASGEGAVSHDARTVLPGDTSQVQGLGTNAVKLPPRSDVAVTAAEKESPFADLASAPAPSPKKEKAGREAVRTTAAAWWQRPPIVAAVGAAILALAVGTWLLAGVIFRVETDKGTLVVEIKDPDVEARIKNGQLILSGPDGKVRYKLAPSERNQQIDAGPYKIRVEGADGLVLDTPEFTLRKGREVTVRVTLKQKGVKTDLPAKPDVPGKSAPPADPQGFVPLFNGKDLTGWKSLSTNKARWEVKDAVLSGSGDTGYLFNDGTSYENFHLRVEAMINDGGNSGVFFRAPFGPTTPQGHPAFSYEAQINITHKDPNKTGSLYLANKVAAGLPNTLTELDKWFTLEVIADGPHVVVRVNGKVTANFIDLAVGTRSGRIALQVLDAATVVQFRKIDIKELPPGDLRLQYPHGGGVFEQVKGNVWLERVGNGLLYWREHARNNDDDGGGTVRLNRKIENDKAAFMHITRGNGAWWNIQGTTRWTQGARGGWSVLPRTPPPAKSPAARIGEWVPLLNGKDLRGWETAGNKNVTWTCEDQALVGRSSAQPAGLLLSDRADYENFHLRLETRLSEGAYGSLFLRCGPPNDGTTGNKCYAIRIGASSGAPPLTGSLVLSAHLDEAVPLLLADAAKVTPEPGEWFVLEVIAEGNHLRVLIEGKTVVDYTDANKTFTVGRIGLVCRPNSVLRFRKIEIKELPPTKTTDGK